MNTYNVKFAYEGEAEPQIRTYQAANAGQAFLKCLKEYPEAKPIEAWKEGGYLDGYGITTYNPPSVVKVQAGPTPKEEQMKFNFRREDRQPVDKPASDELADQLAEIKNERAARKSAVKPAAVEEYDFDI